MKRIKLKNGDATLKKKLVFSITLSITFAILIANMFIHNLSSELPTYISNRVKKENLLLLKEAFSNSQNSQIPIDELITVITNSKDEITEVNFDMKLSTALLSQITNYLNESLIEYDYLGYRVDVPIGFLTNNPIFTNVGPRIPVKVELSDVALGNVRTSVKSFGINNALVEVYLDIFIRATIIYPFASITADSEYSSLVASKIIAGTVPNFFGGTINSKSDTINLPLDQ